MNTFSYRSLDDLVKFFADNEIAGRLIKFRFNRADGVAGVYDTLKIMTAMKAHYKTDMWIRSMVLQAVGPINGNAANIDSKVNQLFKLLRKKVPYTKDTAFLELIQSPRLTLRQGGDCDCLSLLAASMLESVGIPTSWVLAGQDPAHPSHILLWIPLTKAYFDLTMNEYDTRRFYPYYKTF